MKHINTENIIIIITIIAAIIGIIVGIIAIVNGQTVDSEAVNPANPASPVHQLMKSVMY